MIGDLAIRRDAEVVIVGAGVAGLTAALAAAPRPTLVLTKTPFGIGGNSVYAQGGVAVAMGQGDSPGLHAADTVAAGAGLTEPRLARLLAEGGPAGIRRLIELGARFDRQADGRLAFGQEAAHSRRRVLHANGDATGAEMVRALVTAVEQAAHLSIAAEAFALDLVVHDGRIAGVLALDSAGRPTLHLASAVVLATGGAGQLYRYTTNPREATADGLAMAARAGARLVDLEFVQFHPTALAAGADPMPLLTEALRGEGAILVDAEGRRFMKAIHEGAELAPRDVVARGIWQALAETGEVWLDARDAIGERFPERFPTVFGLCREQGLDPRRQKLPVSPAAHYHMGGIQVDEVGRSSLEGLWACGEVATTGLHGANRLASNSLLEALVFGERVGRSLRDALFELPARERILASLDPGLGNLRQRQPGEDAAVRRELRELMWRDVGLERDRVGLERAERRLDEMSSATAGGWGETRNLLTVSRLVARAARLREESRGSHLRKDHPRRDPSWRCRLPLTAAGYGPCPAIESGSLQPLAESVA